MFFFFSKYDKIMYREVDNGWWVFRKILFCEKNYLTYFILLSLAQFSLWFITLKKNRRVLFNFQVIFLNTRILACILQSNKNKVFKSWKCYSWNWLWILLSFNRKTNTLLNFLVIFIMHGVLLNLIFKSSFIFLLNFFTLS